MKTKKVFASKLAKFLVLVLLLIVLLLIALPFIIRQINSEDDSDSTTTPDQAKKPSPSTSKKNPEASNSGTEIDNELASFKNLEDKFKVESDAKSSHLTAWLAKLFSAGTLEAETLKVVDAYLDKKVDPNALINDESPALFAARIWSLPILQKFGKIDFSVATKEGWTIMHVLCRDEPKKEQEEQKLTKTIKYLIEIGSSIEALNKINNFSPLMYAIECHNFKVSKILLDNGAKPDSSISPNFSLNPLMVAVQHRQSRIIKLLTERKADVLAPNKNGLGALQFAVISGFKSEAALLINLLKEKGIQNPQDLRTPNVKNIKHVNSTLLHLAVEYNQFEIAKHLILQYNADRSLVDGKNKLAIQYTDDSKFMQLFKTGPEDQVRHKKEEGNLQKQRFSAEANRNMAKADEQADLKQIEELKAKGLFFE